jgi:hypothetical protein
MIEEIRALLLNSAPVAALVARRIYWGAAPVGGALPALVLRQVTGGAGYVATGEEDGVDASTVQIDCGAADYPVAVQLRDAVRATLSGYKTAPFQGIFLNAERDGFEGEQPAATYVKSLDFRVVFNT